MMTEAEAKTKWCPLVRQVAVTPGKRESAAIGNRFIDESLADGGSFHNPIHSRCIGSDCMMWRWRSKVHDANPSEGWCGAAGRPVVDFL